MDTLPPLGLQNSLLSLKPPGSELLGGTRVAVTPPADWGCRAGVCATCPGCAELLLGCARSLLPFGCLGARGLQQGFLG